MRLLDPMTVQTDEASGNYITVPPSASRDHGSALCRFEVSEAGDYEIWVHAFAASGESNSFYAAIDRGSLALTDVNRLNQWHWLNIHHRDESTGAARSKQIYGLTSGTHTLQLRNRESGTKVDKVVVARTGLRFDPQSKSD